MYKFFYVFKRDTFFFKIILHIKFFHFPALVCFFLNISAGRNFLLLTIEILFLFLYLLLVSGNFRDGHSIIFEKILRGFKKKHLLLTYGKGSLRRTGLSFKDSKPLN